MLEYFLMFLLDLGDVEDALRLVNSFDEFNLSLHNNPWRMPPEAVVEQGLPAVKSYLLDVQQAKAVGGHIMSLQLLKLVLVGSSGAGKTRCVFKIYSIPTRKLNTRTGISRWEIVWLLFL